MSTRAFSVTVRDESDSAPIANAAVCINDRCAHTQENGRARVEDISTDWHQAQLAIEADGYGLYSESVNIDEGQQPPFGDVDWQDVYLQPEGSGGDGLTIEGDRFLLGGQPFLVRGSTDFRLAECALRGIDIVPILQDRLDAGANWFRVLAMKKNNTGWWLNPREAGYEAAMRWTIEAIGGAGAYVQWCVFADTKEMMPQLDQQQAFWEWSCNVLCDYPWAAAELCNEASHVTQNIKPAVFTKPNGILSSHGSETADKFPVRPLWDWAGYSARRSGGIGKVVSNYAPLTAFEQWPQPCLFGQETFKPASYGHDPSVAAALGRYARAGTGGVFHHDCWNEPRVFNDAERACASAFFEELQ